MNRAGRECVPTGEHLQQGCTFVRVPAAVNGSIAIQIFMRCIMRVLKLYVVVNVSNVDRLFSVYDS